MRFAAVVFDCDSTLTAIEGIDELAADRHEQVAALTTAAMQGAVPLEAVYGRRLELIRPNRGRVEALGRRYVQEMVPDAAELVRSLLAEDIGVRILSGGLRPAVLAVAGALGVDAAAVAAVDVAFDDAGEYAGFDAASPLARSGGKRDILELWRRDIDGPVMMVGDGVTDLEAAAAADLFVAYAGVVEREAVVGAAGVVLRAASLSPVFALALGGERPRSVSLQDFHDRGLALLEERYRPHSSSYPNE
ncbi:MAG: HAD-IB family phosphatase [Gemmatimonadota bacterium]